MNPDYVKMTKQRLNDPFISFDSLDLRSKRVPMDLKKEKIRTEYLKNHVDWFLNHHKNARIDFRKNVKDKYGVDINDLLDDE